MLGVRCMIILNPARAVLVLNLATLGLLIGTLIVMNLVNQRHHLTSRLDYFFRRLTPYVKWAQATQRCPSGILRLQRQYQQRLTAGFWRLVLLLGVNFEMAVILGVPQNEWFWWMVLGLSIGLQTNWDQLIKAKLARQIDDDLATYLITMATQFS